MTTKDLVILYRQEKGIDPPQPVHNLPEVMAYIDWLEENLVLMSNCVDDLTAAIEKTITVVDKHNPQIN